MICEKPCLETQGWEEPPARILIVEDDLGQAESLALGLGRLGYKVETTRSGEDALGLVQNRFYSAVIMDICLPGIDGLTVCQLMNDQPNTTDVPVILLSGIESEDLVLRARNAGSRFFLRKPYDPNALLILVESVLAEEDCWQN